MPRWPIRFTHVATCLCTTRDRQREREREREREKRSKVFINEKVLAARIESSRLELNCVHVKNSRFTVLVCVVDEESTNVDEYTYIPVHK